MKHYYILLAFLFIGLSKTHGQNLTVDVPISSLNDTTFVFGYGSIDSIDITDHFQSLSQGQVFICQNSTVIFKGNQSSTMPTFYVADGSKLILKDSYFYPKIYLGNMAELDAQGGNQNLQLYRMASSILTDTANCNFWTDTVYSSINFTFSNWPNASSPCNISPTATQDFTLEQAKVIVVQKEVRIQSVGSTPISVRVFSMQGQLLLQENATNHRLFNLQGLSDGFYIIQLQNGSSRFSKKIQLQ